MKKYIQALVLGIILIAGGGTAHAATRATFFPSTVTARVGEQFSLPLLLDPQGLENYSATMRITFPVDLLTVTAFDAGGSVIPLTQAGYDSIDNVNGVIIKSGGFPGGINAPTLFGTIRFTAKRSGVGNITVVQGSMALDSNNNNVIDIGNSVPAVITVSALPASGVTVGGTGTVSNGTSGINSGGPSVTGTATVSPTPSLTGVGGPVGDTDVLSNVDQSAAAASSTPASFFSGKSGAIAVGVIILLIIAGIIYSISRTA